MKIGIIGAGNIGRTLGKKWSRAGHDICFGVRNPTDPKYSELDELATVAIVSEAITFGDVVLLAMPGSAVPEFVAEYATSLASKTIIDATNNPRAAEMNYLRLLADHAPGVQLVRAFSTLGWENFASPKINGVQIDLFYCADPTVRTEAERLIADVGLRPAYIGDIDTAPALDGMTRVWFALALRGGYGRRIAFKLLQEE